MTYRVYVDGAYGTVGSSMTERLSPFVEKGLIALVTVPESERKNVEARAQAMRAADVVVICLPDALAKDAASMALQVNPSVRILDASAAHRCESGWVYGLRELAAHHNLDEQGGMSAVLASAQLVANPGCFATGCVLIAQAVYAALLGYKKESLTFFGVTGYSAAGHRAEDQARAGELKAGLKQFGKEHRHLAEISKYGHCTPALTTVVGTWARGMMVQTDLKWASVESILPAVQELYGSFENVEIVVANDSNRSFDFIENADQAIRIVLTDQPNGGCGIAVFYDNLGKGAAGQAIWNLRQMLRL